MIVREIAFTHLEDRFTGAIVRTYISDLSLKSAAKIKSEIKGWNFVWEREIKAGRTVYRLALMDSDETQGLIATEIDTANKAIYVPLVESAPHNIGGRGKFKDVGRHLFAFAGRLTFDNGYDYIYFDAKTLLIDHYRKTLGAYSTGYGGRMVLYGDALKELVNSYFNGGVHR